MKGMRDNPLRLARKQRQLNHEAIFALNRKYLEQIKNSNVVSFDSFPKKCNTNFDDEFQDFIDEDYRTPIRMFMKMKYHQDEIQELINMLTSESVLKVYQGVMGISSFGSNLINRQNELNILGTGIVPKLWAIIGWHDHLYLQLKGLSILSKIVGNINRQIFIVYFDLRSFHQSIFLTLLHSNLKIIHDQNFKLLSTFARHDYLPQNDQNIQFLLQLDVLLDEWQDQIDKVKLIMRILNQLRVRFGGGFQKFANEFYRIKHRILRIYIDRQMLDEIKDIIVRLNKREELRLTFSALTTWRIFEPNKVGQFFKDIITLSFTYKFKKEMPYLKEFIISLMEVKEASSFVPLDVLFSHTLEVLLSEQPRYDRDYCWIASSCIQIFSKILTQCEDRLFTEIMNSSVFFSALAKIYNVYEKKLIKKLNSIICHLVSNAYRKGVVKVLLSHNFIEEYFKSCNRFDCLTGKSLLKSLKSNLNSLLKRCPSSFELIKPEILAEKNMRTLTFIRKRNSLDGIDEICKFYYSLRDKGKVIDLQKGQSSEIEVVSIMDD